MRTLHRITPSEITNGSIYVNKSEACFFAMFKTFDASTDWGPLYARKVGSRNIWFGFGFMRRFNPGDYMVFEKLGPSQVKITRRVSGS